MSFGKATGGAVFSAITGTLLVMFGMKVTAIVCAAGAALVLVYLAAVRERRNEKLMPWTEGGASPKNEAPPSFREMYDDIRHSLWLRASVVVMLIMFIDGMVGGYGRALMPIAAVKVFGLSTPQWADLNAIWGFVGAAIALGLGPLIDRFSAKAMMGLTVLLTGIHAFTLAFTQEMWSDSTFVLVMMALYIMLNPVTMVCALALAMSICHAKESATQFAIYMSVGNIGATLGAVGYGQVAEYAGWDRQYALLGLLIFFSLVAILMYRTHGHPEQLLEP
jgi:PAT family beta-lactamase induction signal transducer AmpG